MDAKLLLRKLRAHTLIYSEHDRAAEVVADLMAERDRLRGDLAALSLCEPGFLDRVIRERDEALNKLSRAATNAAEQGLL